MAGGILVVGGVIGPIALLLLERNLDEQVRRELTADADLLGRAFDELRPTAQAPPVAGGLQVLFFDPEGVRLVPPPDAPAPELPGEVVRRAVAGASLDWRGRAGGQEVRARLVPWRLAGSPAGAIAVVSDLRTLEAVREVLVSTLLPTAAAAVVAGVALALVAGAAALAPLRRVAREARAIDPERPTRLAYTGPADELGALVVSLNELMGRLRVVMDQRLDVLAEASHELRTPLTALEGYLERVDRGGPGVGEDLADARRIAQSMARLVGDLLDLSRLEAHPSLELHIIDPGTVALRVAQEYPGVRVEARKLPDVLADPQRLEQVFRNLVSNAVRAAGASGVVVGMQEGQGEVRLAVTDSGPGLPEEVQRRLFQKFVRGATGGNGLGLAIVHRLVTEHGGRVEVQTGSGGTTFTVVLPVFTDEPEDRATA